MIKKYPNIHLFLLIINFIEIKIEALIYDIDNRCYFYLFYV